MPEILLPPPPMIALRNRAIAMPIGDRSSQLVHEVSAGTILNYGREHLIFPHPHSEQKVVGIRHNNFVSAEQAKLAFDVHQVFSTLFPHNFPKLYAISGIPEDKMNTPEQNNYPCVSIRERITGSPEDQNPQHSRMYVEHFLDAFLVEPEDIFDWVPGNFTVGADGGDYFMDIAETPEGAIALPPDLVGLWMDANKVHDKESHQLRSYSDTEKKRVQDALKRIEKRYTKDGLIQFSRPELPTLVFSSVR